MPDLRGMVALKCDKYSWCTYDIIGIEPLVCVRVAPDTWFQPQVDRRGLLQALFLNPLFPVTEVQ